MSLTLLLGQNIGCAAVAIDPAEIKGVLPLPLAQLRAGLPGLGNPRNLHKAVSDVVTRSTLKQFRDSTAVTEFKQSPTTSGSTRSPSISWPLSG